MEIIPIILVGLWFVFFVISLAGTVLWIWMIIDCATKEPSEGNDKLVWLLIIIFTSWIGALIYFLVRRPERKSLYGQ